MHNYRKKCFAKDTTLTAQQVIDELMLVPLDQDRLSVGQIFVMNEMAGHIWGLLDGKRHVEDILGSILEEFEVTPERAETDLVAFLRQLEQVGVVWVV
jgi:hypothetical protein